MAQDAFFRNVAVDNMTVSNLKAALLGTVKEDEEAAQTKDENTEQLKLLNQKLDKLVGGELVKEMQALGKLVKTLAGTYKDQAELKGGGGGKAVKSAERLLSHVEEFGESIDKNVTKAVKESTDQVSTFGEKLSQAIVKVGSGFEDSLGIIKKDLGDLASKQLAKVSSGLSRLGGDIQSVSRIVYDKTIGTGVEYLKDLGEAAVDVTGKMITSVGEDFNKLDTYAETGLKKVGSSIAGFVQSVSKTGGTIGTLFAKDVGSIKMIYDDIVKLAKDAGTAISNTAQTIAEPFVETAKTMAKLFNFKPQLEATKELFDDLIISPVKSVASYGGKLLTPIFNEIKDAIGLFDPAVAATKAPGGGTAETAEIANTLGKDTQALFSIEKELQELPEVDDMQDLCRCICKCLGYNFKKSDQASAKEAANVAKTASKGFKPLAALMSLFSRQAREEAKEKEKGLRGRPRTKDPFLSGLDQFQYSKYIKARGSVTGIADILGAEKPLTAAVERIGPKISQAVGAIFSKLSPILGGLTEGLLESLIKPITQELENQEQVIRTTFVQSGMDVEETVKRTKELVVTEKDVIETGQMYAKIQKQQLKNLQRGITDTKALNRVTNMGLQTGTQIGANAEDTADMFADWKLKLGASNQQLFLMKSGLLDIARSTGVFGDKLKEAAKNSMEFMQNMRKAGTFTATAANNMTEIMARAEKTGTSEGAKRLIGALSGSIMREGVNERDRGLILRGAANAGPDQAAIMNKLIAGTIQSDTKLFGKLIRGMMKDFENAMGKPIEQFTQDELGQMGLYLEQTFGPLKEWDIVLKNALETTKNFEDKWQDLNKLTDMRKRDEQREQLVMSASNKVLGDFTEALKEAKGDATRAFDIVKQKGDIGPLLEKIGGAGIEDIIRKQADVLEKRVGELKLSEGDKKGFTGRIAEQRDLIAGVMQAVQRGEPGAQDKLVDLIEDLNKIEGEARMALERQTNPAFQANVALQSIDAEIKMNVAKLLRDHLPDIAKGIIDLGIWLKKIMPTLSGGAGSIIEWIANNPKLAAAIAAIGGLTLAVGGLGTAATAATATLAGPVGMTIALTALAVGVAYATAKLVGFKGDFADFISDLGKLAKGGQGEIDALKKANDEKRKKEAERLDAAKMPTKASQEMKEKFDIEGIKKKVAEATKTEKDIEANILQSAKALKIVPDEVKALSEVTDEQWKKILEVRNWQKNVTDRAGDIVDKAHEELTADLKKLTGETVGGVLGSVAGVWKPAYTATLSKDLTESQIEDRNKKQNLTEAIDSLVVAREKRKTEAKQLEDLNKSLSQIRGRFAAGFAPAPTDDKEWQAMVTAYRKRIDMPYAERIAGFTPEQQAQEAREKELYQRTQKMAPEQSRAGYITAAQKQLESLSPKELAGKFETSKVAQEALSQKTREAQQEMAGKLIAVINEQMSNKMTFGEYNKALEDIALLKKIQAGSVNPMEEMAKNTEKQTKAMTEEKSIYTHDTHLEKILNNINSNVGDIASFMESDDTQNAIAASMLDMNVTQLTSAIKAIEDVMARPTMPISTVEQELKRKQAEDQDKETNAQVENNTRETALRSRQTVGILRQIARLLARRGGRGRGVEPPTFTYDPFDEEPLAVGWQNADNDTNVGTEFTTDYITT